MNETKTAPTVSAAPVPRRAQLVMSETELRAAFGLAPDETLRAISYDPLRSQLHVVVESPRLPEMARLSGDGKGGVLREPTWDVEPPYISLPISAHYEQPGPVA